MDASPDQRHKAAPEQQPLSNGVLDEIRNDVYNGLRVSGALGHAGLAYTREHPGRAVVAAVLAAGLLPELSIGGPLALTAAITAAGAIGVVGLAAESYVAGKRALPDLKIVWGADRHSSSEVTQARHNVDAKMGRAVADVGNAAFGAAVSFVGLSMAKLVSSPAQVFHYRPNGKSYFELYKGSDYTLGDLSRLVLRSIRFK